MWSPDAEVEAAVFGCLVMWSAGAKFRENSSTFSSCLCFQQLKCFVVVFTFAELFSL
jgi:hypothetical protein